MYLLHDQHISGFDLDPIKREKQANTKHIGRENKRDADVSGVEMRHIQMIKRFTARYPICYLESHEMGNS